MKKENQELIERAINKKMETYFSKEDSKEEIQIKLKKARSESKKYIEKNK